MSTGKLKRFFDLFALGKRSVTVCGPDRAFLLTVRYLSWKLRFQKRVSVLSPRINFVITALVLGWVRMTIRLFRLFVPDKYTDADPYKCIWVDPLDIKYTTGETGSKRRGWVVDGNWDQNGDRYMDRTSARAIEQRFIDGMSWKETILVEKYDEHEFKQRTQTIERLHRTIQQEGYKSQRQLLEENPKAAWNGLNDAMNPLVNEVFVDIGRDGELLWNMCGQHRLAIAKILEIDQIPVQVFRRHEQWQAIRNRVRNDKHVPEQFLGHPDLEDLLRQNNTCKAHRS